MKPVNPPLGRGRLLEVAAQIFATEGTGALTVRRLAQDLGTSTMSLYSHFTGKDELIQSTADEFVVRFSEALKSVPVTDDPLYDFACLAYRYRSISLENRDLYRVAMISGRLSLTQDTPGGIRGMFEYCANAVGRCITSAMLTIRDPSAGLMVFWTGVHGQVALEMEKVFQSEEMASKAWNIFLRAIMIGLGADTKKVDSVLRRAQKGLGHTSASPSKSRTAARPGRVHTSVTAQRN